MKTLVCLLLLAAVVAAEPPRYRQARQENGRQETQKAEDAPYPAAGFRPATAFNLPTQEELSPPSTSYGIPATSYGAPLNTYTAPQTEYGPPPEAKAKNDEAKVDVETIEGGEKKDDKSEKKEKLEEEPNIDAEIVSAQGAYYVLLPGSQLQRVQFQTENDIRKMSYTARVQYAAEDRAPLYVYSTAPQYRSAAYLQLF